MCTVFRACVCCYLCGDFATVDKVECCVQDNIAALFFFLYFLCVFVKFKEQQKKKKKKKKKKY